MAATATQIHQLYVAYFGRAADLTGLEYWTKSGASVEDIASAFGNSAQPETAGTYDIVKYPATIQYADKREAFIDQVYTNLFGRDADAAGKAYWSNELAAGKVSVSQFLLAVVNGAQGDDAAIIANKAAVSAGVTDQLKSAGTVLSYATDAAGKPLFAQHLADYLTGVDANPLSVENKLLVIENDAAGKSGAFADTAAVVVAGSASINGTDAADTFSWNGAAVVDTKAVFDGKGGNDTLILTGAAATANAAAAAAAQFKSFETLSLEGTTSNTVNLGDFTNSAISTVKVAANDLTATISGIGNGVTIDLAANKLDAAGTADADVGTLTLNAKDGVSSVVVNLNGGDVGAIDVVGGASPLLSLVNNAAASHIASVVDVASISGAQDLKIDEFSAATLNASKFTGNLDVVASAVVSLTSGSGNDKLDVKFATAGSSEVAKLSAGAGDDVVTLTAVGANRVATVDLGAGNDKIIVNNDVLTIATSTVKLLGGAGNDTFEFGIAAKGSNVTIGDFASGDKLVLDGVTGAKALSAADLAAGGNAPANLAAAVTAAIAAANTAHLAEGSAVTFQFGGDTHVLRDADATASSGFVANDLLHITLTGNVDLAGAIQAF